MNGEAILQRLNATQDRAADTRLLQRALSIESVTGNETGFARFLETEMAGLGLVTGKGEFAEGRENVWGTTAGCGSNHLMFVGHTDTVHVRGWQDRWRGDIREDPFGAPEIGGEIWGRGACDLKGGICAAIAGLRLLQSAGFRPAGGITLAFIGDEESGEPGSGVSAGIKDLEHRVAAGEIARPDFAIYVEPTQLNVYTAQIGFFIPEITVTGRSAYFGTPELGVDALKATHELLTRIWAHEAELSAGPGHELVGRPSMVVTGIEGGGFIAVPGECKLSMIRTLCPGESLDDAVQSFEAAILRDPLPDGISVSINYPAGRDHPKGGSPVEIANDSMAVQLLQECVRLAHPRGGAIDGAPYWSETPFLVNGIGCPAVYCAPGDIAVAHTFDERIDTEEYLAAIRAFAIFTARYCGLEPT